ncbi:hypothetical protein AB0M95_27655 [Sphaerisporangium sp. NPDC051017]|uniref:hypothetical protein n=1 Tax=Sphaerisporangium sp. NPDC051017 TaxID=3154636 RepID=UPI0034210146
MTGQETGPVLRGVRRLVARADEAVCARDERFAALLGWQVTRVGFGARAYRDPRFDHTPTPIQGVRP